MKLNLLFCSIFILLTTAWTQSDKLFWDGTDWQRLTRQTKSYQEFELLAKSAYINGVLDGRLYDYLKLWSSDSMRANSLLSEMSDYLTTSELIKSLDNFYADPFNRIIPIPSAIIIANMYAEQQPLPVIEEYIKKNRDWINTLTLELQKEDKFNLIEKKRAKHSQKIKE